MNNGIPYFPLDVHVDDKIKLIEAEFGLTGFSVIVKLYQKIYGEQGYYCEWTNDVALLFSKSLGLGRDVVSEIVKAAIRRGIFDKDIFEKYQVLTSKGVQRRYFEAVSRRKNVEVKKEYLLVQVAPKYGNVSILSENADIAEENAGRNGQRKEEKRKVKKSKEEESKEGAAAAVYDDDLKKIITVYEGNIAPITSIVREAMADWLKDVEAGVVIYAINEAAKHNARNWAYINAVIKWQFDAGNKTLEAVQLAKKAYKANPDNLSVYEDRMGIDMDAIEWAMRKKYDKE